MFLFVNKPRRHSLVNRFFFQFGGKLRSGKTLTPQEDEQRGSRGQHVILAIAQITLGKHSRYYKSY
jgi:hypothetical protein